MKERLKTIADMVSTGKSMADIGTDHAFLPIELVRTGKSPYAIAMDVVQGPLERARIHISEAGLSDRIECRLSDGFDKLNKDEVDVAVIAGMGGDLISDIISRKPDVVKELILSPHSHPEKVRAMLRTSQYHIVEERMIVDVNKYYVFIKALRRPEGKRDLQAAAYPVAAQTSSDAGTEDNLQMAHYETDATDSQKLMLMNDFFGPLLIRNKDNVLRQYLLKESEKFRDIDQKKEYMEIVGMALSAIH